MAAVQPLPSRAAVSGAQQLAAAAQAAYGRSDYKECVRLGQQASELLFGSVLTPKALADGTTIQSVCAASQASNPELYSSAVSCLLLLSAGYFCLRDFPAALAFALQAAKAAPHAAEPLSNMANVYRELGDAEKAAVCYRQALKANPASADAAGNLASLLMQTGEQDEAIAYFERAVVGRPTHVAWTVDLGHLYRLKGRLPEARACFQKAVSLNASFALAWHNLGCVLKDEGDSAGAIRHLRRAIELAPSFADSYAALGNLYKDGRMLADAERTYGAALTLRPDDGITLGNLAATQLELGRVDEALSTFSRALKLVPDFPDALSNYGNALRQKGRPQEALAAYKRCLELTGNRHTDALNNAANVLKDLGDGVAAESYYRQALALRPRFAGCLSNLANLLREKGELEEALRLYDAAIEAEPGFADPHNNRGNCLKDMGRFDDAVAAYQRAIAMRPDFPDAYGNCAAAYKDKGDLDSAIVLYRKALSFKPRDRPDPIPFCNYLHCMQTVCDWTDRDALFRQACAVTQAQMAEGMLPAIQPHHALVYPLTAAQQLAIAASYSHHSRKAMLAMGAKPAVWALGSTAVRLAAALPLALRRTLRPELLQALSAALIADATKSAAVSAPATAASDGSPGIEASAATTVSGTSQRVLGAADGDARGPSESERAGTAGAEITAATSTSGAVVTSTPAAPRRLRVAFVSSDLGDHPLSHLMRHVFIWMDRRRFEVHCYATAPDDGSSWRREIAAGVEAFHDAATLSHAQLAALIHSHGIDVAINLNGFTKGSRSEAFALCPAPVQVMYLGFPGSSGSAYHQYVVTDSVTTPVELSRCFTERLAHMPSSYFVNDHAQAYAACAAELTDAQVDAARGALGLPPRPAVVYCMHNQLYKCDPRTFDAWARILSRVPGSVLWLLQFPPSGEAHIRQEARARGLPPWRFVFSPVAPKDEHIQRLRVADLFLDTPLCNAHTTGTDALWAGVPLLTLPQETMASRVGSSLLQAVGCPELIQPTLAAYEEAAVALGNSLPRLRALQATVRERRFTAPLFDTRAWVRDWENLLTSIVHDYVCLCQAGVDPVAGIEERAALALAGQRLDAVKPGTHAAALGSGAVALGLQAALRRPQAL